MNGRQFDCGVCMICLATYLPIYGFIVCLPSILDYKKTVDVDIDTDIDVDNTICTFSQQLIPHIGITSSKHNIYVLYFFKWILYVFAITSNVHMEVSLTLIIIITAFVICFYSCKCSGRR